MKRPPITTELRLSAVVSIHVREINLPTGEETTHVFSGDTIQEVVDVFAAWVEHERPNGRRGVYTESNRCSLIESIKKKITEPANPERNRP